jgi:protein-tyrosine-phosphatase
VRVLILCTGNSARSQMAEGLLRHLAGDTFEVFSAGTDPRPAVHPLAVETMRRRYGVDIHDQYPKHVDAFAGQTFDYVLTVCDAAAEACPTFPGRAERIHWSFADPAAVMDPDAARRAFEAVAVEINTHLRLWLTVLGQPTAVPMPSS